MSTTRDETRDANLRVMQRYAAAWSGAFFQLHKRT